MNQFQIGDRVFVECTVAGPCMLTYGMQGCLLDLKVADPRDPNSMTSKFTTSISSVILPEELARVMATG